MNDTLIAAGRQLLLAAAYYAALVTVFRLAGKRLAGQTTTFDLVVLIGLAVVLQQVTLGPGTLNALVFVATVFGLHMLVADLCVRWRRFRLLVRGAARPLVRNGQVSWAALEEEKLSYQDLLAGLRKVGFADPAEVRLAILEETGHISAVGAAHPDRTRESA